VSWPFPAPFGNGCVVTKSLLIHRAKWGTSPRLQDTYMHKSNSRASESLHSLQSGDRSPKPAIDCTASKRDMILWLTSERFQKTPEEWRTLAKKFNWDEVGAYIHFIKIQQNLEVELEAKSADEIRRMFENRVTEVCKEIDADNAIRERSHAHSQPYANLPHELWALKSYWTADEAAAIWLGKDPRIVSPSAIYACRYESSFARQFFDRLDLITRAQEVAALKLKIAPEDFASWADSLGLPLPTLLLSRIRTKRRGERNHQHVPTSENQKVLNSLQIIVAAWAVEEGYHPSKHRNSAIQEMWRSIQKAGLKMDEDTLRKHVKESAELLPAQKDP
jgi:hypothetical protein